MAFDRDPRYRGGLTSYCKHCRGIYTRARRYGLSPEELDAMLVAQFGQCAACEDDLNGKFHVDHCHASGRVRALLCAGCNWSVGHLQEDVDRALKLAAYIRDYCDPLT